jgi:cell division septum initiation protein DivIVA
MTVISRSDERLTPDRVQSITFPASRLGRRGLDEDHVRAFCAHVEQELVTLLNEKAALWEEVDRLRRRILGDADEVPGYQPDDAHVQAVRILSNAQQTADRYVADAQHYSRQLAEDARRRRDEVLAEARAHAERVLEEAHQQASRAAAVAMSGDQPADGRPDLQGELAYMRTFSDVYRNHLRAYLEALLRNVEEWERAEKSSLATARADGTGAPWRASASSTDSPGFRP